MTIAELKTLCKDRGLPVSGKKAELVARLEEDERAEESEPSQESDGSTSSEGSAEDGEGSAPGKEENADGGEDSRPPYGAKLPDPHEGKPEVILDDEGHKRYLCLDGKYRRGDPDAVPCSDEHFSEWLTEWVVAARTGQLEGADQKTFFPNDPDRPGNPRGRPGGQGKEMRSDDVLRRLPPGKDKRARWEYDGDSWDKFEFPAADRVDDEVVAK